MTQKQMCIKSDLFFLVSKEMYKSFESQDPSSQAPQ